MPPPHAPRTVYTLRACTQPRSRHERASQDWVARRLASLCGWAYGGAYETRSAPAWHPYFVPDETLDLEQATRLGIQGEDDLFGGVVPHAFVASKVITHGVPDSASPAPPLAGATRWPSGSTGRSCPGSPRSTPGRSPPPASSCSRTAAGCR